MKNKIIHKIRKELELSNFFFDGEINLILDIISKNINTKLKDYNKVSFMDFIKEKNYQRRNAYFKNRNYIKERKNKKKFNFKSTI